jgi:hypothetical protein
MMKKVLIWINVLLLLGFLLILFELQSIRTNLYDDPVLQYFGEKKDDIIRRYGKPDFQGEIGGPGGDLYLYEDKKISFIFAGGSDVVNNLEIFTGKEFLGVKIGMTFDEIVNVLGDPRERGYDPYEDDYTMVYYLGKEKDGMGEIEVWFSAKEDSAPTTKAQIFWKKYWR